MAQKRRLGRGLESLIGGTTVTDPTIEDAPSPAAPLDSPESGTPPPNKHERVDVRVVDIGTLVPNKYQPRESEAVRDVADLAESIRQSGILQPVVVRPAGRKYEIIAGERRWRAAQKAGLTEIPVLVRAADDQDMLELALVENIQRTDLNPIERARAYDRGCREFGLSPQELGQRLGENRTTVSNYVRLLKLPEAVLEMVRRDELTMGHARCLLALESEAARVALAHRAVSQQLSVRRLEEEVRRAADRMSQEPVRPATVTRADANLRDLERRLAGVLGTRVAIHGGRRKGGGRIVIHYRNLDEFDRLAGVLGLESE